METAKRMEELCQLLLKEDAPVTEWFKLLNETLQDTDPLITQEFSEEQDRQSVRMPLLPQLLYLIRGYLLNHRWSEALQILENIVQIPLGSSNTVWKVGTELMSMEGDENRDLIQHLFRKIRGVSEMNEKEVLMEYVAYLLHIGDDEEACTVMQEVRKRHGLKKITSEEREKYTDHMHKAYLGLLWYLEWKKYLKLHEETEAKCDGSKQSDNLSQHMMNSQKQSMAIQMENFCEKAKQCFNELKEYPGIWDIFITKHAELLTWQNKEMDAFAVLKNYCEKNPGNLNAHKYLYIYCKEHFPEHEDKISSLQTIAKLSPSYSLLLDLCTHLIEDGDIISAVPLLFSLLDYSCWQSIEKPWRIMSECLKKIHKDK
ncbi:TATA box-binding protein-associated factor RNA polymerase I subunit A-like isoform X2 [Ruditapes philippinarum]|uniref:TATA box-binding protein-associated factor RNA polymerase I subunit A-like isoform X2 n=1 Tax=Ruditapes philippinarum TaxID=129788 RepID=UPI00295B1447|nr:TATA box-binding protein-associated factor RNA polymerase I subunit A-like isoform X2 [Ruditapes philippinarum]